MQGTAIAITRTQHAITVMGQQVKDVAELWYVRRHADWITSGGGGSWCPGCLLWGGAQFLFLFPALHITPLQHRK